jgi:excinuclease ABC subunit B
MLSEGLRAGLNHQTLLGVTGSGKTFTMASIIQNIQKPILVMAHNKTLAAQLYSEFKEYFPHNAVEYFVSYYDYYQPEAYIPSTDTYIEKDSSINEEIDRMRHSATKALMTRRDVIVVSSVSCIYGLGVPEEYFKFVYYLKKGQSASRQQVIRHLVEIHYERNDTDLYRGTFRVRGDVIEVVPVGEKNPIRLEFFGDELERITELEAGSYKTIQELVDLALYPAKHYIAGSDRLEMALKNIEGELTQQIKYFEDKKDLVAAQRIKQKTKYDLEMIREIGYCSGIENYSRQLEMRGPGQPPSTLLNYFPKDYVLFIDESHATIPQIGGMSGGDRARKDQLVNYGFRLPSARDNRPLTFDEFTKLTNQVIYVSATPADYELKLSKGHVAEQIIRPTGLIDPETVVRPVRSQVQDLMEEIKTTIARNERVLVTALTKRMSEELAEYLKQAGYKVAYLHSDIETLDRIEILHKLRTGEFDILVGVNLLREGLDLPEVSLIAILDADKEGFLRSERSLIQIIGRAARNLNGRVLLYADTMTDSLRRAIAETNRRRTIQVAYNKKHQITPVTIRKEIKANKLVKSLRPDVIKLLKKRDIHDPADLVTYIDQLRKAMVAAAENMEFEQAAVLRDEILRLEDK